MATALSHSNASCLARSSSGTSQRLVVRPGPLGSSTASSTRNVQVCAKGKGRRMQAPMAPSQQMIKPPTPEVDPENEEFCLFLRSTTGTYQNWVFVSVVKGGSAANALVKSLQNTWGRQLYSRVLIANIGASAYKERDAAVKGLKDNIRRMLNMSPQAKLMEPLLNQPVSSFQFAFKIRDKSRPGDYGKAENLTIIPPEAEVNEQPLQRAQKFFSPESLSSMFGGGSSS